MTSTPTRSQAQRLRDLERERDRAIAELLKVRGVLGSIRDAVFSDESSVQTITDIKRMLLDDWDSATPPSRMFDLMRSNDTSGVSGTGRVAEGVEFECGKVAVCWLGKYPSVNVYDSIHHVQVIHGHGGATQIVGRDKKVFTK